MQERLLFQYIMNYKAYRRIMISSGVGAILLLAGGALALCVLGVLLGILVAAVIAIVGTIIILASVHKEKTYMVFSGRIVIKSGDKRREVFIKDITSVKYRRAFYEKDLATGTVTVKATVAGKKKTYRLSHIFDAKPCVKYITENMGKDISTDTNTKEDNANESNG